MKFAIVVDLNMPPQIKRWSVRLGVPALILGVAGVAFADSAVKHWTKGDPLTAEDLNAAFQAVTIPPGTVIAYGGQMDGNPGQLINGKSPNALPPSGWLFCNGFAVEREGPYATLFKVLAISFGEGDKTTTFNLPDLRGQFLRGLDAKAGIDVGRTLGSTQEDSFAEHTHKFTTDESEPGVPEQHFTDTFNGYGSFSAGWQALTWRIEDMTHHHAGATDESGGTETRPKNVAVNYIIKY